MAGNSFGQVFRVTTAGESHGPGYVCIVDGCPPGLELSEADLQPDLDRAAREPGRNAPPAPKRDGTDQHVAERERGMNHEARSLPIGPRRTGSSPRRMETHGGARNVDTKKAGRITPAGL